jgi:hypothetical protein
MRYLTTSLAIALLAVLCGTACERAPEGYREAQDNFDVLPGVKCPKDALIAAARKMDARSEDVRVIHFGPTGRPDHSNYIAALSREGDVLAGVFDEAAATIPEVQYEKEFGREDFVWVMKCLRNDPPFGDRKVRYGIALPVALRRGVQDIELEFVDGWAGPEHMWSTGTVTLNPAGTQLLSEDHGLDFAIRPRPQ